MQPNQPGVSQDVAVVGSAVFSFFVVVVSEVVVSSKHPHQPGVLHVDVRVVVVVVVVVDEVEVVEMSE